jgi:site-specific DNA recombinase
MSQAKKRAALYARFSSDLQKDRSIDDQLAVCQAVAKRDELKIVATFNDRAKSGASMFERDGLLEMMTAAKANQFDVVIVESLDRLSRDQEDMAGIFKRLSFHGVEITTANEGATTPMHVGIRGIVSSMFLADLGAKVKRGHNGRVREGKFPGAVVYGYDRILGKPGERQINPEQAKIVVRIFREYASGLSPRTIAENLTRDGILTPSGAKVWNHQSFIGGRLKRGMIGNPIYAGKIVWNTARTILNPDTGRKTKRAAPDADRISTQVPHLRIVDQALWDAANKVRSERAVAKFGPTGKVARRKHISHSGHLLGGLLRCGACGGHMRIAQVSRDGGPRVACASAHQHGTCEHRKSYDLTTLTAGVIDGIRDRLLNPKQISEAMKALHTRFQERTRQDNRDLETARKQLNRVEVQISRLVDAIADSDQPVKPLVAKLDALEGERASLAERLRLLEAEGNVVRLHPQAVDTYCKNMEQLHRALCNADAAMTPENRTALRMVFDSIVVHPTAKRMPYEFTPYARLGAILGVDLAPAKRPAAQILEDQGVSCTDVGGSVNSEAPTSAQVVCLGRWQKAA